MPKIAGITINITNVELNLIESYNQSCVNLLSWEDYVAMVKNQLKFDGFCQLDQIQDTSREHPIIKLKRPEILNEYDFIMIGKIQQAMYPTRGFVYAYLMLKEYGV